MYHSLSSDHKHSSLSLRRSGLPVKHLPERIVSMLWMLLKSKGILNNEFLIQILIRIWKVVIFNPILEFSYFNNYLSVISPNGCDLFLNNSGCMIFLQRISMCWLEKYLTLPNKSIIRLFALYSSSKNVFHFI